MTKHADQTERYENIVQFLKQLNKETSEDESMDVKSLLRVDIKNMISSQRSAKKTIQRNKAYAFLVLESYKSTIFKFIPQFYLEIDPLIFVIVAIIIFVFIVDSNPLGEPLFLSLFIINNINKFRGQLDYHLII